MTQGQADATADSEHPLVGQTIASKYKITRLLGEGGMGCVYQGEQILGTTTRKVAVKTLHKHLSGDESIKARFKREVGTVAALEHPNTIQVYDFGEMEDGTLYIVMEFIQGQSVADILEKEGAMPPERVENILRQIVGSLEEAHGHGIVHRDLKPDNIVLCERAGQKDWVEVLDFGIAKRSTEHDPNEAKLTQQGMVLGTPPYMSPEQFTGQPVDARSDIYALGVMAYEMLSGRLPWVANTAWEWASRHMSEPPTPLEQQPLGPNVPERMRAAVARALAKTKDDRFPSARAFFDALSGSAEGATSGAAMAPASGGTAAMLGAGAAAASSDGAQARAKTEMATPAVGGAAPGFAGSFGGAPMMPAAVPSGPTHTPAKKGGPPMLVVGLAGLAVLLLVGAGIAFATSGKKKTAEPLPDLGAATATATATETAPSATTEEDTTPFEITSAAPLDTSATKVPAQTPPPANQAAKPKTPAAVPTPTPTPKPAKAEPAVCQQARDAKSRGQSAAIVRALEGRCRSEGGTL